jgi:hypothetical protein
VSAWEAGNQPSGGSWGWEEGRLGGESVRKC